MSLLCTPVRWIRVNLLVQSYLSGNIGTKNRFVYHRKKLLPVTEPPVRAAAPRQYGCLAIVYTWDRAPCPGSSHPAVWVPRYSIYLGQSPLSGQQPPGSMGASLPSSQYTAAQ